MLEVFKNIFSIINKDVKKGSRVEILDFLRGGAMILVLLHHSGFPFGRYILDFHMPFFFILSGYIEKCRDEQLPFKKYVKKRFYRLIVPYFSFEFINLVIWYIICGMTEKTQSFLPALFSIIFCFDLKSYIGLLGGRIWFFPCLFISDVLFWGIRKLIKTNPEYLCTTLILFFLSLMTSRILPFRLPYMVDTAMMATAFIVIGYIGTDIFSYFISGKHIAVDIIIAILMSMLLFYADNTGFVQMYMYINRYGNYILTIVAAIAGSIAYVIVAKYAYYLFLKLSFLKSIVLWYSYNSLIVFFAHLDIKCLLIQAECSAITNNWWLLFVVMFVFSIPISNALSNYLPFLFGQTIKVKSK
jgi:fucose 4-O-acetylase-like acetyltransferase